MTQTEYEQKKRECWEEFKREDLEGEVQLRILSRYEIIFRYAFDRAYALGKQDTKQEIKQETDAEGEEMLTVPRSQIQKLYSSTKIVNDPSSKDYINGVLNTLDTLFGSKCLPDELNEDNFAKSEQKYHVGQIVKVNGVDFKFKIQTVSTKDGVSYRYTILGLPGIFTQDELSPFTKSVDDGNVENLRQKPAEPKDDIRDILMYTETENRWQEPYKIGGSRLPVADRKGSGDDRRLNIAVQIMSGIMSNQAMMNNLASGESTVAGVTGCIVDAALVYTDALLAKFEKKTI